MKNKGIAVIIAAAILASVLTGCSNNSVGTESSTSSTQGIAEITSKAENQSGELSSEVNNSESGTSSQQAAEETSKVESQVSESLAETSQTQVSNNSVTSDVSDTEDSLVEESSAEGNSQEVSTDVFSLEFTIDNETYKLPFKYADMEKNGWSYKNDAGEKTIKSHQYLIGTRVAKDDMSMSVQPINLTDSEVTAKDAHIGEVVIDDYYIKTESHEVKYGTVVLGKSTLDDVIAAFGEPSSTRESENHPSITYKKDTYLNVKFTFDNTNGGILNKIEIHNFNLN